MIVILDNGHGGLINGKYQTKGKRSPKWQDRTQLYEGEFNRAIVNGIVQELIRLKINFVHVSPEYKDTTLSTRVKRANKYDTHRAFYLSIHSNAGGGQGSEVYTSPGETKSDKIASIFGEEYQKEFPKRHLRIDFSDGDLDKEQHFYVLTKTKIPAILTENFFMDNEAECKNILMTKKGREKIITYHVKAIVRVKNELYN